MSAQRPPYCPVAHYPGADAPAFCVPLNALANSAV